jgi:hypothetical protein
MFGQLQPGVVSQLVEAYARGERNNAHKLKEATDRMSCQEGVKCFAFIKVDVLLFFMLISRLEASHKL